MSLRWHIKLNLNIFSISFQFSFLNFSFFTFSKTDIILFPIFFQWTGGGEIGLSGFPMRILSLFCLAFMLFFQEIESTIFFFFFPISLCLWIGLLTGPPSVWNVEMGQKAHTHKLLEMILVNPEKSGHWKRRQAQCPIITSLVDWAIGSHYWTTPAQISWVKATAFPN